MVKFVQATERENESLERLREEALRTARELARDLEKNERLMQLLLCQEGGRHILEGLGEHAFLQREDAWREENEEN